mmetsp:Transcript_27212/g.69112  ORF Transcript_27212/g.69112 Transcript_27212/m.69112 type:complete len:317 (+) Transcript_27212:671-1621(+)
MLQEVAVDRHRARELVRGRQEPVRSAIYVVSNVRNQERVMVVAPLEVAAGVEGEREVHLERVDVLVERVRPEALDLVRVHRSERELGKLVRRVEAAVLRRAVKQHAPIDIVRHSQPGERDPRGRGGGGCHRATGVACQVRQVARARRPERVQVALLLTLIGRLDVGEHLRQHLAKTSCVRGGAPAAHFGEASGDEGVRADGAAHDPVGAVAGRHEAGGEVARRFKQVDAVLGEEAHLAAFDLRCDRTLDGTEDHAPTVPAVGDHGDLRLRHAVDEDCLEDGARASDVVPGAKSGTDEVASHPVGVHGVLPEACFRA